MRIPVRFSLSATLCAGATAAALAATPAAPTALVTHYAASQFGGITTLVRYTVARPDRSQTRYLFLSSPDPRGVAQEVPVESATGDDVHLADTEGADCTLAHVEAVTGARPVVLWATRTFAPNLADNDQSAPAAMDIQAFRPVRGEDPDEPAVMLRASGPPVHSRPLCRLADIRRAMLATLTSTR